MLIRHPDSARGNDLYETPEVATLALLRAEPLSRTIWEPACGPGAIVRVLRDAGHRVIATDLFDYRSPDQDHAGRDFLLERKAPDGVEMIVTNPPFKLAAQFAAHALSLCPRVAMLLRLAFLESTRRNAILDGGQLARVHVFRNRLPMMHRDGWAGNRVSNPTAFAWFVWERGYTGKSAIEVGDGMQESLMLITDFVLTKKVSARDLFGERLKKFGIREHVASGKDDERSRCLTDGSQCLAVFLSEDGFVDFLTAYGADAPRKILHAICEAFGAEIFSEHELQLLDLRKAAVAERSRNMPQ